MMFTLDKISRLAGRRLATSGAQSGRWMSMDAQTSRNGSQDVQQGSQSVRGPVSQGGSAHPVGTDAVSNQHFFSEMKKVNGSILKMNDSILAFRLESPQMEARLTKLVTDTEGRLKDTAAKNKEDLTKLVADSKLDLKDAISKVQVSKAKVFAAATAGATLVTIFLACLRLPGFIFWS